MMVDSSGGKPPLSSTIGADENKNRSEVIIIGEYYDLVLPFLVTIVSQL